MDGTTPDPGSSFAGRIALITGAARGIGETIARELHAGGAYVAVSDLDQEAAETVAQSLDPTRATAIAVQLDVREKGALEAARDRLLSLWRRVDIVVNNAGHGKRTPTQKITPQEFDAIVAVNMRSVFFSCQIFGELMRQQGYGRIINITSLAGQNGFGTVASPHYAASKAGAICLTKAFAHELAGTGVTVNAISPGPIATALGRLDPEQIANIERLIPVGRFGKASEIAAAAALLASERGGFTTGATIDINGGLFMR